MTHYTSQLGLAIYRSEATFHFISYKTPMHAAHKSSRKYILLVTGDVSYSTPLQLQPKNIKMFLLLKKTDSTRVIGTCEHAYTINNALGKQHPKPAWYSLVEKKHPAHKQSPHTCLPRYAFTIRSYWG